MARAARDLAIKGTDVPSDEKKRLIYEAFDFSKRALELNESSFAAHKWYAITIGDVGDYEGVKAKISNAYVIRDHLEVSAVCFLLPYAHAFYIVQIVCFIVLLTAERIFVSVYWAEYSLKLALKFLFQFWFNVLRDYSD